MLSLRIYTLLTIILIPLGAQQIENIKGDITYLDTAGNEKNIPKKMKNWERLLLKKNACVEIKVNHELYYYVFGPSEITARRDTKGEPFISVKYGKMVRTTKQQSIDKASYLITNINLYTDAYPFKAGETAIIYLLSDKIFDKVEGVAGKDWPHLWMLHLGEKHKSRYIYRGIIGFDCATRVSNYLISITCYLKDTDTRVKYKALIPFTNESILPITKAKQISGVTKKMLEISENRRKVDEERNLLHSTIYTKRSKSDYTSAEYTMPAEGAISSEYGLPRRKSSQYVSYHRGLDIAAAEGTPVKAANSGIVRLAENLYVRGKCIVIDHGAGVYSSYFHLSKILVKEGDIVNRLQTIGEIGQTGSATGPHLHWEMRAGNTCINPKSFLNRTFAFGEIPLTEIY